MRGGMRPLVIAIDAGHGGQDPGARGPSGSREKDDHPGDRPRTGAPDQRHARA